jgi:hypothetical protein
MNEYETAVQLIALWRSGRAKFASFFRVLTEIRDHIGSDALPQWCADNLRLHISMIDRMSGILRDVDAERTRHDLEAARAVERKKKAQLRIAAAEEKLQNAAKYAEIRQKTLAFTAKSQRRPRKTMPNRPKVLAPTQPPGHQRLAELLSECEKIETLNRVELGRRYSAMKDIVKNKQAGCNLGGKHWGWVEWASTYIKRSRQDIHKCIQEFVASCDNTLQENVINFPQSIA